MRLNHLRIFDTDSNLAVPVSKQTSIVDVSRATYCEPIIYEHKFAMDINNLGHRDAMQQLAFT